MKRVQIIVFLILTGIVFSSAASTAEGQKRKTTKRRSSAAKTTNTADQSAAAVKTAREHIALQIKTLSRFLYLYSGIAKGIETTDQMAGSRETPVTVQQNELNKGKVRDSIRNVREGLADLEAEFRLSLALRGYYPYVSSALKASETAQSQAAANRFDEAGRSLLTAVNQLADALATIR